MSMRSLKGIRSRFGPEACVAHVIAAAVLIVLPAIVVTREGVASLTTGLIVTTVFGIGYLVAAVLGGKIISDIRGETAGHRREAEQRVGPGN